MYVFISELINIKFLVFVRCYIVDVNVNNRIFVFMGFIVVEDIDSIYVIELINNFLWRWILWIKIRLGRECRVMVRVLF